VFDTFEFLKVLYFFGNLIFFISLLENFLDSLAK